MQHILLTNAKIYTADDSLGTIENGYVLIDSTSGKIESVGSVDNLISSLENVLINRNTLKEINLKNKYVYPGFIDAHTHLGICESFLTFEGDDTNEITDPVTPQLRAIDAVNPLDAAFKEALCSGVTSVAISPGSANPIGGEIFLAKTYGKILDEMIVKQPVGIKFALGENPKSAYSERDETPVTRMATVALIRESLYKAKKYYKDLQRSFTDEDYSMPDYDIKSESLIPLLKREIKAYFHAHRTDDICTAIRIAKEFNLDYAIVHCTQGHLIKEYLSKEKVNVLLGPILGDACKPELSNASARSSVILSESENINLCVVSDHPETPVQYLLLSCKVAVEKGLNEWDALKSITINPAKLFGIEKKSGSISIGKDANINIFSSNPFTTMCLNPETVICEGHIVQSLGNVD